MGVMHIDLRDWPLLAYSLGRSLNLTLELRAMNALAGLIPGLRPMDASMKPEIAEYMRRTLLDFLAQDVANIRRGEYPAGVLWPENPWTQAKRFPKILLDILRIARRRAKGETQSFSAATRELLEGLPRYYQRNFHFQTDGYMSEASAEAYEHQVEMLFAGSANAMRRMIVPPLKAHVSQGPRVPRILELGCGRGTATRFVRAALPHVHITGVDLSPVYLKHARAQFASDLRCDFLQGDAAQLPFRDGEFDAVYSVFLYHELPLPERQRVLREMLRVSKAGAFLGLVDSIQRGDVPQMDAQLQSFPEDFHEPFFRNYTEHPMEELFAAVALDPQSRVGFLSKAVWATRP